MALIPLVNPLSRNGTSVQNVPRLQQNQRPEGIGVQAAQSVAKTSSSSVTSLPDTLQAVKESSLLYQLISRLLLSPEQDQQLSESLDKAAETTSVEQSSIEDVPKVKTDIQLNANWSEFSLNFANLASYDENHDGKIYASDQIFNSLLMMRLEDNKQFISALSDTDIKSINLGYKNISATTASGDSVVQISDYQRSKGGCR